MTEHSKFSKAGTIGRWLTAAVSVLLFSACSSAPPQTASSTSAAAASAGAEPAELDLCGLPDLAPAELRSKPGYTEFAVSVFAKDGAPITTLKQQDFAVECGAKQCPISYFRRAPGTTTPVSMFIVTDASHTMWDKIVVKPEVLPPARANIENALLETNSCSEIGAAVVGGKYVSGYDPTTLGLPPSLSAVTLVQPFTTDDELAIEKIYAIVPSGPDRMPDAIKLGVEQLEQAHYPRRVLVVMSDGADSAAVNDSIKAVREARSKGIGLWVIGIGDTSAGPGAGTWLDRNAITELALAGGGRALFASPVASDKGESLARAIRTVATEAGEGYSIGVLAPPGAAAPVVTLAKPSAAEITTAAVPSRILEEAAARPIPASTKCSENEAPPEVRSNPAYTEIQLSVTDGGKPVTGLKQTDFKLDSDNQNYPIKYFHETGADSPQSIMIAIDTSGSMIPKLQTVRAEFKRLIEGMNPCDQVALMAFSGKTYLLQRLTTKHNLVEGRLKLLHAYGQTALYDAIATSVRILENARYRDRAVILLTDGIDNVSVTSRETLVAALSQARVPVYAVGIGDPAKLNSSMAAGLSPYSGEQDALDKPSLDAIAAASRGREFIVPEFGTDQGAAFSAAITAIGNLLAHRYTIGYDGDRSGEPPTISIVNHPAYAVRALGPPSVSETSASRR